MRPRILPLAIAALLLSGAASSGLAVALAAPVHPAARLSTPAQQVVQAYYDEAYSHREDKEDGLRWLTPEFNLALDHAVKVDYFDDDPFTRTQGTGRGAVVRGSKRLGEKVEVVEVAVIGGLGPPYTVDENHRVRLTVVRRAGVWLVDDVDDGFPGHSFHLEAATARRWRDTPPPSAGSTP